MTNCQLHFRAGEEDLSLPCYQLSIWKTTPKEFVVTGTQAQIDQVTHLIRTEGTAIWINPDVMLKPDHEGYRLMGSKRIKLGHNVAWWRSNDARCVWPDSNLYDILSNEPFETPLLPEWIPDIATSLKPSYLKSLYGYQAEGQYLDQSLNTITLDRHIQGLVKRKALIIKEL